MTRKIILTGLLGLVFSGISLLAQSAYAVDANIAKPTKKLENILILRPDDGHPFWDLFEASAVAACAQLSCKIEAIKANWDHLKMLDDLKARLNQPALPDVVIFQSFKKNGAEVLKMLEAKKVYGIMANAGFDDAQHKEFGYPREKFKYWIGQLMPNDKSAGKLIADALYKKAVAQGATQNGKIRMLAIEGNRADGASIERVKGLQEVVAEHKDIELVQMADGRWKDDRAYSLATQMMDRYPDVKIIWAAGDSMALQVVKAAKERNKVLGKDMLTAGVDWSGPGLAAVASSELLASAGGHYMEGAWATIMAYDFFNNADFGKKQAASLGSEMSLLTADLLPRFNAGFSKEHLNKIDYVSYSMAKNPETKAYRFTTEPFFK